MSALNSTTIVAPTTTVVHITDLLPRLHKPDEPVSSAGAATIAGFLPATHATSGVSIMPPAIPSPLFMPNGPSSDGTVNAVVDEGGVSNMVSDAVGSHSSAALLSHPSSAAAMLNRLLSVSAQVAPAGGTAMAMPGSNGPSSGSSSSGHKKCPYHRQCSRSHHHLHQHHLHQQQHQQQQTHLQPSGNIQGHPYAAAWNRYRNGGSPVAYPQQRDAISTNVSPPPPNAVLLAGRYLMMEAVEGNNLYHCCDIKTRGELVCKVANNPCSNLLTAHFRLEGHPHVNPLHKVIQDNNKTYLLFNPSEGDLHSYVRVRKRLREPEARRLCRQMCEVVKSCHEQGIVLRDLKLRKFVFADRERTHLKLESLEDAVVLDDPTEDLLQDKRGCPAYVSPEILRANTTYSGKAADMWSLGVILYTMLVGRYPFNDSEHASLFAKISRGQFTVPECLSSKARCMIRALLRRDPEERIASEDVLYHPWLLHDDSKDHAYGSLSSGGSGSRSNDDHCVPEWFDPSEDADSTRTNYTNGRDSGFDSNSL